MPKGGARPGAGRKPGIPNKINTQLKEMILGALDGIGGQDYLMRQAEENPSAFMTLLGKVLPTTLSGDKENPLIPDHASSAASLAKAFTLALASLPKKTE